MLFCDATASDHQRDLAGWLYIFALLANFTINVLYLLYSLVSGGRLRNCKKAIERKREQMKYDRWLRLNISQKKNNAEKNPGNNELLKKYEYMKTIYEIKM